jgi:hypothetical protein
MTEQNEVNKDKKNEQTNQPRELKFKLGDVKGFEEAIKRLKLDEDNSSR